MKRLWTRPPPRDTELLKQTNSAALTNYPSLLLNAGVTPVQALRLEYAWGRDMMLTPPPLRTIIPVSDAPLMILGCSGTK